MKNVLRRRHRLAEWIGLVLLLILPGTLILLPLVAWWQARRARRGQERALGGISI